MKKIQAKSQSYLVGYRRPPKTHQFRKGHSGNPSGERKRPSNVPDLKAQLEGALNKTAINNILKESTTSLLRGVTTPFHEQRPAALAGCPKQIPPRHRTHAATEIAARSPLSR